jgi:hypothetical protein
MGRGSIGRETGFGWRVRVEGGGWRVRVSAPVERRQLGGGAGDADGGEGTVGDALVEALQLGREDLPTTSPNVGR